MKRLFVLFGALLVLILGCAQTANANLDPNPDLGQDCLIGQGHDCPVPDPLPDPVVHVCVDGQVQSMLASVAATLHLDILGADEGCPVTTTTTLPVPPPLVHVCINGQVESVLADVAANLHLDILGADQGCPVTTTTLPPAPVTVPDVRFKSCLVAGHEVKVDVNAACPDAPTSGSGKDIDTPAVTQPAPNVGQVVGTKTTPLTPVSGQLPHTGVNTWLAVVGFAFLSIGGSFLLTEKLLRHVPSPKDLR